VLKAFAALPEGFTYRDLRHDLERMTNVQRGEVRWSNLPRRFHEHPGIDWFAINLKELGTVPKAPQMLLHQMCPEDDDKRMVLVDREPGKWTGLPPDDRDEGHMNVVPPTTSATPPAPTNATATTTARRPYP
jgi:hypothetical protein